MSRASPPAFDRESLHAWLLQFLWLFQAGELHRRAVEVPPTTSLRGIAMREIPSTPVQSCAGTPGDFVMSTLPATSAGVNPSGGTANPGASGESSPSVSEEDEADDSPSSEL